MAQVRKRHAGYIRACEGKKMKHWVIKMPTNCHPYDCQCCNQSPRFFGGTGDCKHDIDTILAKAIPVIKISPPDDCHDFNGDKYAEVEK